ncbi:MAG TPA: PDZ domain-containing protein [Pyrinomonadaceae bacterium]|jgi:predicted metalloprotease with PDZ domain|nr:PDZ domain-containing protein [Pyrinomonadaceae bacterium]
MPKCQLLIVPILFTILTFGIQARGQNGTHEIAYTVSMPRPHTHLFEIDIQIKESGLVYSPAEVLLVMPVWTPGSYLVREFERNVQDFAATDAKGQQLKWEKVNKNTWRIVTNKSPDWHATYKVYANELSVRTSELNSSHGYWNNANLLMYPEGFLKHYSRVRVVAPDVWKVATGLPPVPGQRNTFLADNFDVLYDSPFEVSNFKTLVFNVKGVPHRIVIDGEGNYDPERMRRDVQKIVETQVELMGGEVPYRDYTFILHLRANAGGGLEHLNSASLGYPRFGFTIARGDRTTSSSPNAGEQTSRDYRGFLSLVAHEFFHLWNVKRIRPDALGPFDYTRENYTKLLWVAEGITDYYADLTLRRAGLISDGEFMTATARAIQQLQNTPGRLVQSVEESSFDSWVKFYRPDENTINSQVSYYDKGAILGLLLDLEIRKRSKGAKSLDDVLRTLYTEFFKNNRNYTPADFQRISETAAGGSLEEFFAKYVRGVDELNYNAALEAVGLRLDTALLGPTGQPAQRVEFGADLRQEEDRLLVTRVYAGSPAYDQGLNTGDQIVALDNARVTRDFFNARLAEKKPGDLINLTIFRFDELSTLLIKLGGRSDGTYRIVPLPAQTEAQKRMLRGWLGS